MKTIRLSVVALFLSLLVAGCSVKGIEVPDTTPPDTGQVLFELDWQGATDPFDPLPEGWAINQGTPAMFAVARAALGEEGYFLQTINEAGGSRILDVPIDISDIDGVFYVDLEAGVEEITVGDALFFPFASIFDFRISAQSELTFHLGTGIPRIKFGVYEPGTFLDIRFELNAATKTIDRVWVNGELATEFSGTPWLNTTPGEIFKFIATTSSSAHIYWKRVAVTLP